MKRLLLAFLTFLAVICLSFLAVAAEDKPADKTMVYYFHGTFRCFTCASMEKYSREAIEAGFKDALQSGRLEFKAVNVEERVNEHFVKDYQLYTKSLILSYIREGKEIKSKNLDKIWELAQNKQKFIEYVTQELNGFMKDAQ